MKNLTTIAAFIGLAGILVAGLYLSGSDLKSSDAGTTPDILDQQKRVATPPKQPSEGPEISPTGPWPKAVAEEIEYNFGRAHVNQEMEHTFTIRNDGPAELVLVTGTPTCQCTKFTLDKTNVPPGEVATLLIEWKGKAVDTSFAHGGPVFTNDPDNVTIRFRVEGVVDQEIEMRPEGDWNLGEVSSDSAVTMHGFLYSNVFDSLTLKSMKSESGKVTLDATPLSSADVIEMDARSGMEIIATVPPDIAPGPFIDTVTVEIEELTKPVTISLRAHKPGDIRILPTYGVMWNAETHGLTLGRFHTSDGRSAKLMLLVDESKMDQPLELTEVTADPSFIEVTLTPEGSTGGKMKRYSLSVVVPPGIPRTDREENNPGRIVCKTNHPSGEQLLLNLKLKAF
ncbi:MAG: DUF1573 domain-containing protein [Planctomycetaceae bacterium]